MKVSLIIAVYKDTEALNLIFKSLSYQTYGLFEVVVAEDGNSKEMHEFIISSKNIYSFKIIHTIQDDLGVRKSKSQNNGIKASSGEYLIFIDGDCLLYSDFIEKHVMLSAKKTIISGRRVNLGPKYTMQLRNEKVSSLWLEKNFLFKYFKIADDARSEKHTEEGFKIKVNGFMDTFINKKRKKKFPLLGCNMSFFKEAIISINGFDEGLGNSAMASDTDLEWRFQGLGYTIRPGRFIVNLFHLYHKRSLTDYDRALDIKMLENQKNNLFVCKQGLQIL